MPSRHGIAERGEQLVQQAPGERRAPVVQIGAGLQAGQVRGAPVPAEVGEAGRVRVDAAATAVLVAPRPVGGFGR
ncbi:hypothetical protein ACFY3N_02085 [Streptomyces sp. NPDC000348]|uniref:hypothetical protein n=1 Tax=Streptomyces sp. NPDC000348 TaxID=3364538 RepID=UPI00367C4162